MYKICFCIPSSCNSIRDIVTKIKTWVRGANSSTFCSCETKPCYLPPRLPTIPSIITNSLSTSVVPSANGVWWLIEFVNVHKKAQRLQTFNDRAWNKAKILHKNNWHLNIKKSIFDDIDHWRIIEISRASQLEGFFIKNIIQSSSL